MLDILLNRALADVAQLEKEVFAAPPKDWAEFQQRYGRWLQAAQNAQHIHQLMENERTAP